MNEVKLRPIHYASVSGGKDSLFMLGLILSNQDKYPLDLVVNFDLEIEWQVAKNVINEMERRCKEAGIPFVRIKPRKSWEDLYEKYGFPNAHARWCNSDYKLDCKKQLNEWIASQNCRPVAYIGLCADEKKRFKYEIGDWENQDVCYPLAEEGIEESTILYWARKQSIFEGYYDNLDRMGCKRCPFLTMKEMAYLKQSEPEEYEALFKYIKDTENMVASKGKKWLFKDKGSEVIRNRVDTKWTLILENEQNYKQLTIFDL
ncbi:MAG: hypothetical protein K6B67_05735 [Lachnospiraceae bacterium]|nr:hypothetical protein [Lachnospiraceae bacterium]